MFFIKKKLYNECSLVIWAENCIVKENITYAIYGDNSESSSSSNFSDHSEKFWIDSAKLWIVRIFGDRNVVVTFFAFGGFAVYMAKLWTSHSFEPELKKKTDFEP